MTDGDLCTRRNLLGTLDTNDRTYPNIDHTQYYNGIGREAVRGSCSFIRQLHPGARMLTL